MSWIHIEDTAPRARKPHRCYLCGRRIKVGEVHIKRYGIGDDGPLGTRMHVACEAATRAWDEDDWECHDASEFRHNELGIARDAEEDA